MKKNYNYAYGNLMKSWGSSTKELSKLAEMGETGLTKTLGKFEFNYSCLERLENMITQLEEIDDSLGFDRDEAVSRSEMQRKIARVLLERTRQDFGWVYKDVKSDLTRIYQKNGISKFEELLSESPWMVGVLAEIGKELSIYALSESDSKERDFKMFDLIASKDPDFSQYKFEILKTQLSEGLGVVKSLLASGGYSSREGLPGLLGSKEYYASSEGIVEVITGFLADGPHKLSAMNYEAMFLYYKGEYKKAVGLFDKVIKDEVIKDGAGREKQIAQYYKGLCLQYSGDSKGATGAFESVIKSDTDERYDATSSVKQHAKERLDSLERKKTPVEELAAKLKGSANSYLEKYAAAISDALGKVCASLPLSLSNEPGEISAVVHPHSPSKLAIAVEEAKKVLSKIKFIDLKQETPSKIVSAQEFRDLPKIYSSLVSKLDEAEEKKLAEYCAAVKHIEEAINVVGETETGFDVLGA